MTHIIRLFSVSFNVFAPKIFPQKILSFLFQCLFLDFVGIFINIMAYFRILFVFRAEFGYVRVAEAYFGTVRFFYNTCCLTGFSNRTSRSQNFVKIVQIFLSISTSELIPVSAYCSSVRYNRPGVISLSISLDGWNEYPLAQHLWLPWVFVRQCTIIRVWRSCPASGSSFLQDGFFPSENCQQLFT